MPSIIPYFTFEKTYLVLYLVDKNMLLDIFDSKLNNNIEFILKFSSVK